MCSANKPVRHQTSSILVAEEKRLERQTKSTFGAVHSRERVRNTASENVVRRLCVRRWLTRRREPPQILISEASNKRKYQTSINNADNIRQHHRRKPTSPIINHKRVAQANGDLEASARQRHRPRRRKCREGDGSRARKILRETARSSSFWKRHFRNPRTSGKIRGIAIGGKVDLRHLTLFRNLRRVRS